MIAAFFEQNVGIGVDVESIERFRQAHHDEAFLRRIFSDGEIDYCLSNDDPAPHLAARFAAKEATIKALGDLGIQDVQPHHIEIGKTTEGAPTLSIANYKIAGKITLSHTTELALAFVVVIR